MKQKITLLSFILFAFSTNYSAQNTVCFDVIANPHASISGLEVFTKYINVFGVNIFATQAVLDEDIEHCSAVMAEYLDNDEDGVVDNMLVLNEMVTNNASMVMFETDGSNDQNTFFNTYNGNWQIQDLYGTECHPSGSSQQNGFDATLEEVLHLITHVGYAGAYPSVWGENAGTSLANAMDIARGGQFISIPSSYPATAWYHYNDATCNYSCMATEYVYWSLTTLLGAQDYPGRCMEISAEWEICTIAGFQSTDLAMYGLLTNPNYKFATSIPDGNYCPAQLSLSETGLNNYDVLIYPNPSGGRVMLTLPKMVKSLKIQVQTISGRTIWSNEKKNTNHSYIDLSKEPTGTYLIRVSTEYGVDTLLYNKFK